MSIDSKEIRGASDPRGSVQEVLFRWMVGLGIVRMSERAEGGGGR